MDIIKCIEINDCVYDQSKICPYMVIGSHLFNL